MKPIGHQIIHLPTVDSTHNYIANLVRLKEINHGTAILADEQTHGRGQRGTTWQSQSGQNLITSIFLEFNHFPVHKQVSINHWVTVSLINLLKSVNVEAKIKWPNDIYVQNRKVCGVLVENTISSSGIKHALVGIGLNVNQVSFDFVKASSLRLLMNREFDVKELFDRLLIEMNSLYPLLLEQRFYLKTLFLEHLWKLNQSVEFNWKGSKTVGIIRGTDDFGLLQMEIEGNIHLFQLKEIEFI